MVASSIFHSIELKLKANVHQLQGLFGIDMRFLFFVELIVDSLARRNNSQQHSSLQ